MNRSRVAHVTTVHPALDNRIFRKECVALAQAGVMVDLVAVAERDAVTEGVHLRALPRHRGRLARMVLGPVDAWRMLRRLKPDMLHVHDPELIPMAILWRTLRRRPAVYDAHEDLGKQVAGKTYLPRRLRAPVARLATLIERAADRGLDGVVAATPSIAQNYRRSTLVQNFPWLRDFPAVEEREPESRVGLCYVGGITVERGGPQMLEAVQLSDRSPRLVLAGPVSGDMAAAIAAEQSGRVVYRGVLPVSDVPEVIAASQAGLVLFHPLPNHLEAQPTKLFEYMAAGKPFIASDFEAWRQLLGSFDCGYFIDPEDTSALVAVIEELDSDPARARARGARGRRALVEHFTFEAEAQALVALTRTLLGTGTGSHDDPPTGVRSGATTPSGSAR